MKIYLFIIIIFSALFCTKYYKGEVSDVSIFVPPSKHIEKYSFGFNDLLSAILWVRLVQDIDVCDQSDIRVEYPALTSAKDDEVIAEILSREMPDSRCSQGWVFQMLDVITDLSPNFNAAYTDGATFLSVLVDDRLGAQKIFDKGQVYYPESWEVFYRSAYHELFEIQNPEKAALLLKKAGEKGAPHLVYSLSAKLLSEVGQAEFAKTILENVLKKKEDTVHSGRLKEQLKKINKILQNQK